MELTDGRLGEQDSIDSGACRCLLAAVVNRLAGDCNAACFSAVGYE